MGRYTVLIVINIIWHSIALGQTNLEVDHQPPTLQLGLGGLSFGKGTLDAELIVSIIARKQEEVKSRLVKNMLLNRLDNAGGTLYIYIDNIIDVVLEEKNAETRTRNIFENTVNLVFVYAFADYYFNQSSKNLQFLAETYYNVDKLASIERVESGATVWNDSDFNNFQIKPLRPTSGQKYPIFRDTAGSQFKGLLLDISSEVIKNNKTLRNLGLLRTVYRNTSIEKLNTYLQLTKVNPSNEGLDTSPLSYLSLSNNLSRDKGQKAKVLGHINAFENQEHIPEKRAHFARKVYEEMSEHLEGITNYIGLINYVLENSNGKDTNDIGSLNWNDLLEVALDSKYISDFNGKLKDRLVGLLGTSGRDELQEEELQTLLSFAKKLNLIKLTELDGASLSELLYELYNDVLPTIEKLAKNSSDFVEIYFEFHELLKIIVAKTIAKKSELLEITEHFLFKLAAKLYEFDKAETYDEYLNGLASVGDLFPNDDIKNSINTIVSFLKNYTEVTEGTGNNEGKKVLNFDVESFLISLQNVKYNKFRPLHFQFDVGVNNAHFLDNGLLINSGDTLSNYSFVGEKIGLKLKLYDWKYLRGFNKGDTYTYYGKKYTRLQPSKTPVVSNMHLLLFGSGILYNLANTGTTKDFNRPIYGGGLGLTFFNNLDLNISVGSTIKSSRSDKNSAFINLGFDIRFSEYLQELQRKRQEKRFAKQAQEIKSTAAKTEK